MSKEKHWYTKSWLVYLLLVVFFPVGLALMVASNWSNKKKWFIGLAFTFGWTVLITLAVVFSPPTLNVNALKTDKTLIAETKTFKVEGDVYPYKAQLTVNGQQVSTNDDGEFATDVDLAEGENTVTIKVVDGDKVTEKQYKVQRISDAELAERARQEQEAKDKQATEQSEAQRKQAEEDAKKARAAERWYWHKVVRVIDGDTVVARVDGKEVSIRVIGIDAPESTTSTECFGKESSAKANEFLSNKWIQIERDDSQGEFDKYNRLLRYVWFDNGTDFGRRMIKEGYGYEYTYDKPYTKQKQYKDTQGFAQSKSHGLWASGTCNGKKEMPAPVTAPAPAPKAVTPAPAAPAPSSGGVVKMSTSGICHAPGTTYYDRTTNYTGYPSLDACLNAGGRMPKR